MSKKPTSNTIWDDSYSVVSGSSALSGSTISTARYNSTRNTNFGKAGSAMANKSKKASSEGVNQLPKPIIGKKTSITPEKPKQDERQPLLSQNKLPHYSDFDHKVAADDGDQMLSNNTTFQRSLDEKSRRDIRDNSLPHTVPRSVDADKKKFSRGSADENGKTLTTPHTPVLEVELPLIHGPQIVDGEDQSNHESSPLVGLVNIERKVTDSHVKLAQFHRLFLNKHTLLTKLEACGSRGILLVLVLPLFVSVLSWIFLPVQYAPLTLSTRTCLENKSCLSKGFSTPNRVDSLFSLGLYNQTSHTFFFSGHDQYYFYYNSLPYLEVDVETSDKQEIVWLSCDLFICRHQPDQFYSNCLKEQFIDADDFSSSTQTKRSFIIKKNMAAVISSLYFNLTVMVDNVDDMEPVDVVMRIKVPSSEYILYNSLICFCISTATFFVFILFSIHVSSRSKFIYSSFIEQLPFIFATIFNQRHFVIPEQFYVLSALLCLTFVFNPLQATLDILFYFVVSEPYDALSPTLSLACRILGGISLFTFYACCVCYLEGLSFHSGKNDVFDDITKVTKSSGFDQSHSSGDVQSDILRGPHVYFQHRLTMITQNVHNMFVLPHHPSSVHFLDFILLKVVFLTFCVLCFTSSEILLFQVTASNLGYITDAHLNTTFNITKIVLIVCNIGWWIWIVAALVGTGASLRKLKYIPSRMRQLFYRVCFYQILLGLVGALCIVFVYFDTIISFDDIFIEMTSFDVSAGLSPILGVPFGLIFVSTMVLLLSYASSSLLDVQSNLEIPLYLSKTDSQAFVPLKREVDDFLHHSGQGNQIPFCLELACYLLEASYQTYFNADQLLLQQEVSVNLFSHHQQSDRGLLGPSLDIARLGMKLRDVFYNDSYCTFGFLGEINEDDSYHFNVLHRDEYVVAFRGSTLTNISAGLKFDQIPLPSMISEDSYEQFRKYLCPNSGTYQENCGSKAKMQFPTCSVRNVVESIPIVNQAFPRVHCGFWEAYESVRDQFMGGITNALFHHYERALQQSIYMSFNETTDEDYVHLGCDVYFCGHSLGSAIAILAAFELSVSIDVLLQVIFERLGEIHRLENSCNDLSPQFSVDPSENYCWFRGVRFLKPNIVVYGYGCPRVGNGAFATLFGNQIKTCFRLEVDGDMIAMIPKILGFFHHVGVPVLVDDDGNGDIVINPSFIEARRNVTITINNHRLDVYRKNLEACFDSEDFEDYLQREKLSALA